MELKTHRRPVPALLPKPEGDPAAMDEMAAACRRGADQIAEAAGAALNAVNGMAFRAPAASRVRGRVRGNFWGTTATCDALRTFARHLEDGARVLRNEILAYERRVEERNAALAHNRALDAFNRGPFLEPPRPFR